MATGTILDAILERKRADVERSRRETPPSELETRAKDMPAPLNFSGALWGDGVRLIAEVKRAVSADV